jgi:cellulose synthase/poly-beta-1,6-N-acetylglucosamine synthase-like glycosyltransferase
MTNVSELIGRVFSLGLTLATLPATALLSCLTIAALVPAARQWRSRGKRIRLCALVPAHNEELLIARCIRSLLESGGTGDFEVCVVADNCSDSTATVAAGAGARVLLRTDAVNRGKGHALHFGFERILKRGFDGVLVVDADSVVSPNLVGVVRQYLEAGAEAVQCRYRVMGRESNVRSRLMDLAFLGINVTRPLGRDRLGLSAGVLGNGFALSAALLGSVPYRADSIVEDLEYHIHLVMAGRRVQFANGATVYGEMPGTGNAASSQRSRWEGGRLRMLLAWAPRLALEVWRGRADCIEPLVELAALPLAYQIFLLAGLAVIAPRPFKWWACIQIAVVGFHVIASASQGEDFPGNLVTLAVAPFYVVWKLALLPRIVRAARPKANWIRTSRSR